MTSHELSLEIRRNTICNFGLGKVEQTAYRFNEPLNKIEWSCILNCPYVICEHHQSPGQEGLRRYYFGRAGIV